MITNKLNEYVPKILSICKKLTNSIRLKEIKFQGKPPKIDPLKYSVIDIVSEKIRIELKSILILKNFNMYVNKPYNNDNKEGINKIDKGIKFSKLSSNFREFDIQYKFVKK